MAGRRSEGKRVQKISRRMSTRLAWLFIAVVLVFGVLAIRVTYINATEGEQYQRRVLEQQNYQSRVIPYKRGAIEDRNGTILAVSQRVYNVILDAKVLLKTPEKVAATKKVLSDVFGITEEETQAALDRAPESRYIVMREEIDYDTAMKFREISEDKEKGKNIAGVWLEEDYVRVYPYKTLASDVIGFVSDGNVGNWGIEQRYNSTLNGVNGREYGFLNDESNLERTVKPAQNGNTVVTTIDANLQSIVEEKIEAFNVEHANVSRPGTGSSNTGVIIMDPSTAEVLAMASYPAFDLNNPNDLTAFYSEESVEAMSDEEYLDHLQKIWRNFCISDAYEPGSTAKPFTVAAGLENGTLQGNETYLCGGSLMVSDHLIHCHLRTGHGYVDLEQAIAQSCNVAMMHIGLDMGMEELAKYQSVFGFGQKTGIDLPGETSGLLIDPEGTYAQSDIATNAFGQNFTCSMIQMASAYCALVNGGHYYRPHIVKSIKDEKGSVIETNDKLLITETVSKETSATLRSYMLTTVESGTATNAQVPGYQIGGKTGTAEKQPRSENNYVISFAGFAPAEKPEVVIYVVIDEPNTSNQTNTGLVTTLAHDIMIEAFPYLGITVSDPESMETSTQQEE